METAQGILSVVTANMARAIRVISVQRGHDPRDYTLMAFGGAGPLHAARLARELDMRRVLVPAQSRHPLRHGPAADRPARRLRRDAAAAGERRTQQRRLAEAFAALAAQAERWFEQEGIAPDDATAHAHRRHALPRPELRAGRSRARRRDHSWPLSSLDAGFAEAHRQRYGFATDEDPVEIVTLRLEATGVVRKAELKAHPEAGPDAAGAIAQPRRSGWPRRESFVVDTDLRPRTPAARQPLRRPRHRRADGRHHPGAARHDGAGRPWLNLILEAA